MLVNRKVWKDKSPESIALTVALEYSYIFSRGSGKRARKAVAKKLALQNRIDNDLLEKEVQMEYENERDRAMRQYVT